MKCYRRGLWPRIILRVIGRLLEEVPKLSDHGFAKKNHDSPGCNPVIYDLKQLGTQRLKGTEISERFCPLTGLYSRPSRCPNVSVCGHSNYGLTGRL
jgi:hypothetical protein